jgi:hypothetical protein
MMQAFNLLLAIGSAALIVKKSPFSLLQKGLIIFGYFSLYEYTLISRCYGIGIFLALLFCALYCQQRPRYWGLTLVLALLANTSLLGLIMSVSLAIALLHRLFFPPTQRFRFRPNLKRHLPLLASLLFAWGLSAYQIGRMMLNPVAVAGLEISTAAARAKADSGTEAIATLPSPLLSLNKLLQIILKSHVPIPSFTFHFWNDHLLADQVLRPGIGLWMLLLSSALVGLTLWVAFQLLRKTPLFLGMYIFNSLSLIGAFVLLQRGTTRYYGHLFVFWLLCLWLSRWSRRGDPIWPRLSNSLFTGILCLQVFSGFYAYGSDLRFPFSASHQAAQIIQQRQLDLPILGINQHPVSSVSGYLDRQIYYPAAKQFGSFWDISYPEITDARAVIEALKGFSKTNPSFVAILTEPLEVKDLETASNLKATQLAYVGPSIVEDEDFYLYQVEEK